MKWLVGIGITALIPATAFAADLVGSGICDWCPCC